MPQTYFSIILLVSTFLMSSALTQLGQAPAHYVDPHTALHQLNRRVSSLPLLKESRQSVEDIMTAWSNPEIVLQKDSMLGHSISDTCSNQTLWLWKSITDGDASSTWALSMLDSWAKPEPGIMKLNLAWMGNFDECTTVQTNASVPGYVDYTGQYCTLGASLGSATVSFGVPAEISIGGCFPSGCTEQDIHNMLVTIPSNMTKDIAVSCQETDLELSGSAIATIVLYCIMGSICLLGTLYDFYIIMTTPDVEESVPFEHDHLVNGDVRTSDTIVLVQLNAKRVDRKPGVLGEFLMCFSLYTNGYKLLSTKQPPGSLTCIHGIRFISMTWVILGHTLVFSITSIRNILTVTSWMKRWTFMAITNATVSVDSFFVLSALLTSYLFLRDLEKRRPGVRKFLVSVPIMYLHRYIRLTPAYGFMLLFYACLVLYLYNGPLKPVHTTIADVNCEENWWSAILYVNNIINPEKMCAAWGWYLSNDFQFFLVTPFVVYLMYIVPVAGFIVSICMVVISAATATGISAGNDFGTGLAQGRDPKHQAADVQASYMSDYYEAPWARYQSFGVGIMFGFLLWRFHGKIRIPKLVNLGLWAVSGFVMLLVLYGTYDVEVGNRLATPAEAAIYNGWNRTAWSVALGYIILSCCMGQGGWVNEFLSWPGFVPLSRMTYCAYLVHPVVMNIITSSHQNKTMWNEITLTYLFAAYLTLSYAVAFLFSIVFEAPFMLLDKKYITGKLSKSKKK